MKKEEIKNIKKLQKNDLFFFFCVALFGGCLGTLSIVKALFLVNFKHLTVVTLLQKLQPIFAIILARLLLKEKLKKLEQQIEIAEYYGLMKEQIDKITTKQGNYLKEAFISSVLFWIIYFIFLIGVEI